MSEYDYDKNYAAWLTAAGITPPSDPVSLRGTIHTIIQQLGGAGAVASVFTRTGSGHGTSRATTLRCTGYEGAAPIVENVNTVATSGAAQTIPDVTTDTLNFITLTANCTLTFPTAAAGKRRTLPWLSPRMPPDRTRSAGPLTSNGPAEPLRRSRLRRPRPIASPLSATTGRTGSLTSQVRPSNGSVSSGAPANSKPWDPSQTPGLLAYWNADDLTGGAGAQVSSWTDRKSGIALTQATSALQPTLVLNSGSTGHQAARFTLSTSQYMAAAHGALPAVAPAGGVWVWVVHKLITPGSGGNRSRGGHPGQRASERLRL